jgi:asparagine synthase (glutamine-hydrolysing)
MGMRRLSIIDLATGHQPVANEDRSVWVVFNGEIYNYRELRRDLEQRGHRFATATDTETIVHLYEEYGAAVTDRLRGMFAFAIWDVRLQRLVLGRDRLGIKPLFYAPLPDGLAFASEIKSLLQIPAVDRRLSAPALGQLFTFQHTRATETVLAGVRKLDAGERAVLRRGRPLETERYWDAAFTPDTGASDEELAARLRQTIDEAVTLHMRSDVPLGAFLSGGVDSTVVVGAMSRLVSTPIRTFSIGFADRRYDERAHARHVAEVFGTEHHELELGPMDLDVIDRIVWHLDEPLGDSSAIPTYAVSKLASEHVKVVLTGDGGDELFGGYDKYVVEGRQRRYDRMPAAVKRVFARLGAWLPHGIPGQRFFAHHALAGAARYLNASTLFPEREQARLFTADVWCGIAAADAVAAAAAALDPRFDAGLSTLQYSDLHGYLPLDVLVKVDRMTMAHSIEARPVLLDHAVVECATSIPSTAHIRNGETKYLFKRAMADVLPPAIAARPKQGFAVPLGAWFRGAWLDFVRDTLLSTASRQRGLFNPGYIEHLLALNGRGRNMDAELWMLVTFEHWCRTFLDAPRTAAPSRVRRPMFAEAHA